MYAALCMCSPFVCILFNSFIRAVVGLLLVNAYYPAEAKKREKKRKAFHFGGGSARVFSVVAVVFLRFRSFVLCRRRVSSLSAKKEQIRCISFLLFDFFSLSIVCVCGTIAP